MQKASIKVISWSYLFMIWEDNLLKFFVCHHSQSISFSNRVNHIFTWKLHKFYLGLVHVLVWQSHMGFCSYHTVLASTQQVLVWCLVILCLLMVKWNMEILMQHKKMLSHSMAGKHSFLTQICVSEGVAQLVRAPAWGMQVLKVLRSNFAAVYWLLGLCATGVLRPVTESNLAW